MSAAATAKPAFDARAHFLEGARAAQAALPEATGGLAALRAAGLSALETATWPTPKTESWKYSRLTKLLAPAFLTQVAEPGHAPEDDGLAAALGALRLPFFGGRLTTAPMLPDGVTLTALSAQSGQAAAPALDAFRALNSALAPDAYVLEVREGVDVALPLLLDCLAGASASGAGNFARLTVRLQPHSRLRLVERQLGEAEAFHSLVLDFELGEGAQLSLSRLGLAGGEGRWLSQVRGTIADHARLELFQAQGGSAFRRHEIALDLRGPGAEAVVQGASLTDGASHLDTQMAINHCAPRGTSRQTFRALAAGASKTSLNGRIHIEPGAQKTDGAFQSRNLLLSRQAELNAKPELEIYADDVVCAHGATIGELDSKAVFYLRSRGLSEQAARGALSYAHLAEVLEDVASEPLRDHLAAHFRAAFHAAFSA